MLSSGMKRYHLELMLSSGTTCYHLGLHVIIWGAMLSSGANVIIWDKMLSSGANVIMVSSGANVIIWCYHVMLSSGMITHLFFIFPENFTHSFSKLGSTVVIKTGYLCVEHPLATLLSATTFWVTEIETECSQLTTHNYPNH
jgi:hypothetical protein